MHLVVCLVSCWEITFSTRWPGHFALIIVQLSPWARAVLPTILGPRVGAVPQAILEPSGVPGNAGALTPTAPQAPSSIH